MNLGDEQCSGIMFRGDDSDVIGHACWVGCHDTVVAAVAAKFAKRVWGLGR